ncbi:OLC1v1007923C1 [Oldenlandia corymbosa var. corymbosa]|uniref:OLC1v1007923C1 n=1 Tax=Oldenlandia corymbosa var. corymbosa TaxID=529605 RepID=A0AAV1DKK6_OLDCO|nr:OLC1v1007923C1 [Oldenlandia corymbosa var. corymbosa]
MEFELSFLCIFLFIASLILCILLSTRNSKSIFNNLPLPPGSTGLPVLGETLEFSSMGKRGIPEKFLMDRMNKYSHQVFKTSLLGEITAVCCGVSGNKFLFSSSHQNNDLIAFSWPSSAKKIFPHSGETTKTINHNAMRFRSIFFGFFKLEMLQNCVVLVDVVAKEHLENHWNMEQKEVNVVSMVKLFAFTSACRLFLNLENRDEIDHLAAPFEEIVAGIFSIPVNLPGTACRRGIKAANAIRKKLVEIIREKKKKGMMDNQDCLSHLLTVTDGNDRLSTELEVADQILASLAGSRDSTTSAITFIMKYLAEFPHIYHEVLKEQRSIAEAKSSSGEPLNWKDLQKMKYTWNVASEVLRLLPPVQGNFREALVDLNYSDFFIPKGWKLYWSPHTTHRNPEYFPEPEKFDPSRFERTHPIPYAYVPFGGGSRVCPGKDIARLVILVFMYNVVGKFRWEKMIPDEEIMVLPVPFPVKGLPIRLYPNQKS